MPRRGYTHSEETKRKIGQANKIALKGRVCSDEFKAKCSQRMKEYNPMYNEEVKKKISDINRGKHHSNETKEKIRCIQQLDYIKEAKSRVHKGKVVSEETKAKLRQYCGPKASNWRGGLTLISYGSTFTVELKKLIRSIFGHKCYICGNPGNQVHHIDYDKKNNSIFNFVNLCRGCHAKTNYHRETFTQFFIECLGVSFHRVFRALNKELPVALLIANKFVVNQRRVLVEKYYDAT